MAKKYEPEIKLEISAGSWSVPGTYVRKLCTWTPTINGVTPTYAIIQLTDDEVELYRALSARVVRRYLTSSLESLDDSDYPDLMIVQPDAMLSLPSPDVDSPEQGEPTRRLSTTGSWWERRRSTSGSGIRKLGGT